MAIMTYGKKVFEVNSKKIYTPKSIDFKLSLITEKQDVEGGKSATYIKGLDLISFDFTVQLNHRYVDVKKEIDEWMEMLNKKTKGILTVGGKVISQYPFLLKSVSMSNVQVVNELYIKTELNIELEEYVTEGSKKETSKSSSSSKLDSLNLSAEAMKIVEQSKSTKSATIASNKASNKATSFVTYN